MHTVILYSFIKITGMLYIKKINVNLGKKAVCRICQKLNEMNNLFKISMKAETKVQLLIPRPKKCHPDPV